MFRQYCGAVKPVIQMLCLRTNPAFISYQRFISNKQKAATTEDTNEPIKFFGSQAASWRARDSRSGGSEDTLWFQPYVISGSLAMFLLYFCVFREENDIDKRLEGNLFDQVAGLEEVQLTVNYKYNRENGLDTLEIEKRLSEMGIDIKQLN